MRGTVAASTQSQDLAALLFLYGNVLEKPSGKIDALRAQRPRWVPILLSKQEVFATVRWTRCP